MENRTGQIGIPNTTIDDVMNVVGAFPQRYHSHRCSNIPGRWKCIILQNDTSNITLQLVDAEFEPPRGRVPSDAPVFCLSFEETQWGALLDYSFKWLQWKSALMIVLAVGLTVCNVWLAVSLLHEFYKARLVMLIIGCFFTVLFLRWLQLNIKHDSNTIRVFKQIIKNNYPQCIETSCK